MSPAQSGPGPAGTPDAAGTQTRLGGARARLAVGRPGVVDDGGASGQTTPAAGIPAVRVTGLTKTYQDVRAVDGVSLTLAPGEIIGLLGRNGAGKTTLMRLVTAQTHPTCGVVQVFGENPYENARAQHRMCFVREAQKYPDSFTVTHVLTAASWFYPNWDAAFADHLVEEFDLPRRRAMRKLSRGQLSAAGVIVGLAARAPLTFFDEPYAGLDAVARQQFYDRLLADYAEHPRTVILSTHLIDEVADLLTHVVTIDHGRILMDAPAEELRGAAVTLVGSARAVDAVLARAQMPVLHRSAIGAIAQVTVAAPMPDDVARAARERGIEVHPVSLQQLIVHVTRASVGFTGGDSAGLADDGDLYAVGHNPATADPSATSPTVANPTEEAVS